MFLKPALILFVGGEIVENDMELAIQALERAQFEATERTHLDRPEP